MCVCVCTYFKGLAYDVCIWICMCNVCEACMCTCICMCANHAYSIPLHLKVPTCFIRRFFTISYFILDPRNPCTGDRQVSLHLGSICKRKCNHVKVCHSFVKCIIFTICFFFTLLKFNQGAGSTPVFSKKELRLACVLEFYQALCRICMSSLSSFPLWSFFISLNLSLNLAWHCFQSHSQPCSHTCFAIRLYISWLLCSKCYV